MEIPLLASLALDPNGSSLTCQQNLELDSILTHFIRFCFITSSFQVQMQSASISKACSEDSKFLLLTILENLH